MHIPLSLTVSLLIIIFNRLIADNFSKDPVFIEKMKDQMYLMAIALIFDYL